MGEEFSCPYTGFVGLGLGVAREPGGIHSKNYWFREFFFYYYWINPPAPPLVPTPFYHYTVFGLLLTPLIMHDKVEYPTLIFLLSYCPEA